jgi:membrane protease YdiL (CAAX protease family)
MNEPRDLGTALLSVAEVVLAVLCVYSITLLLVLPLLPDGFGEGSLGPGGDGILELGSRLPTMLAIQSVVFLAAGLLLSARGRIGPSDAARASLPLSIVVGVGGGAATLLASAVVGIALDLVGLPVQEQVWVEDLLGRPDALVDVVPWMVIAGPLAEEVFFRRYAFRLLSHRAGPATGYLGSSILFGVIHLNPAGLVIYVLIGLAFCWLYRRTGTLWTPIAAHVTLNGLVVSIGVVRMAS